MSRLPWRSLLADAPVVPVVQVAALVVPAAGLVVPAAGLVVPVDPVVPVAGLAVVGPAAREALALEFPEALALVVPEVPEVLVAPALEVREAREARASALVQDRLFRYRLLRCRLAGSAVAPL